MDYATAIMRLSTLGPGRIKNMYLSYMDDTALASFCHPYSPIIIYYYYQVQYIRHIIHPDDHTPVIIVIYSYISNTRYFRSTVVMICGSINPCGVEFMLPLQNKFGSKTCKYDSEQTRKEMFYYYITAFFIGIITFHTKLAIASITTGPPYAHDIDYFRQHLATKTPYIAYPKPKVDTIGEKYDVLQFQMVSRHGTRYPSTGDCQDIGKIIPYLQTSKNKAVVGWLDTYKNLYPERRGKELDINGMREMYAHGARAAFNYPGLLDEILDDDVFLYYSALASWSKRTSQSVIAFQQGLFENHQRSSPSNLLEVDVQLAGNNVLGHQDRAHKQNLFAPIQTLFFENGTNVAQADICKRWKEDIEGNPVTMSEANKYKERYVGRIAARMTQELGIPMTTDDVEAVYTGCKFDITHQNRVDTFCTLLAPEDVPILEYRQDLEYYYTYSYGSELNTKLACPLIQSVMQNMENAVNGKEDYTRMDIKVLHSESVFLVVSFLGLFKDEQKLRADWNQEQINNRQFTCSKVSPFGGNVVFQLLADKNENPQQKEKGTAKYVRVLISEEPTIIPGCPGEICPYQTFKNIYQEKLQCSFEKLCN
ncbi:histidine phosphatase superfamily [Phascolomyces articulosus]|uniref:Multiple inositol polyphosphate phosphatase 1 n=1 Tax=Phascolomyces articulosus TaxID=60185 RepID=A0AAD5K9F7_9FUNG|nr:histidine phosphatase superfamily [Phascolomyces articulosus]